MKKNRASFFNETMDYYNTQMPNVGGNLPMNSNAFMSQSGFYMGNMPYNPYAQNEDINATIAKLERQIAKLERRVSILEQNSTSYVTEDKDTTINNMYMV